MSDFGIASNASGDAAVFYRHRIDSYNSRILVATRRQYGAFGAPIEVSYPTVDPGSRDHLTTGGNKQAAVAVGPNGETVVAWVRMATGWPPMYDRVGVAVVSPTGELMSRSTFGPAPDSFAKPAVGIDSQGRTTVLWVGCANDACDRTQVMTTTRPPGGSFGSPAALPNPGPTANRSAFAIAANGDAIATWYTDGTLYAAIRKGSAAFAPAVPIASASRGLGGPRVAVGDQGGALLVWTDCAGENCSLARIMTAHRPPSDSFGTPTRLADVWPGAEPQVAMSPVGEAAVAWPGGMEDPFFYAYLTVATRAPDGRWRFSDAAEESAGNWIPRPAFDHGGTLYVGWASENIDAGTQSVRAGARQPGAAAWSRSSVSPARVGGAPGFAGAAPGLATAAFMLPGSAGWRLHTAEYLGDADAVPADPPPPASEPTTSEAPEGTSLSAVEPQGTHGAAGETSATTAEAVPSSPRLRMRAPRRCRRKCVVTVIVRDASRGRLSLRAVRGSRRKSVRRRVGDGHVRRRFVLRLGRGTWRLRAVYRSKAAGAVKAQRRVRVR